ncbi:hypothetical protein QCN29_12150 [Streptomyces sp. HNM0663]|uniref:Uncharacterized protein n=1 Tax=Streptomyces chengmaiensis TaxID=3040919 RepID=A0ABT6HLC3_9ACTN|nr:hypothetical protein [Streptomyces chengmaiensis]MDH2389534.1 hypothetical protein [Streptomyces chengmaiensis]
MRSGPGAPCGDRPGDRRLYRVHDIYDLQAVGTSRGHLVVVAEGGTLARFLDSDVASAVIGQDFPLPTAVVDAQLAKLG